VSERLNVNLKTAFAIGEREAPASYPFSGEGTAKLPPLECGGRGSEATGDTALGDLRMETALVSSEARSLTSGVAASLCRRGCNRF